MRSRPTADAEALKFRAATLEEAISVAEEAIGGRVKVLEANRIRRGGIGGFFSTDLGVEVSVVPEEESIDEALERLVAESDADERRQWRQRTREAAATVSPSPVRLDPDMLVPEPAEPEISMAALRAMATLPTEEQPYAPTAARRLSHATELVSAEDIVAELRAIAERDGTGVAVAAPPAPAPEREAAPRPVRKLSSPSAARPAAPTAEVAPLATADAPAAPAARPTPVRPAATATPATAPAAARAAERTVAPTVPSRTERVVRGDDGPAVIVAEVVAPSAPADGVARTPRAQAAQAPQAQAPQAQAPQAQAPQAQAIDTPRAAAGEIAASDVVVAADVLPARRSTAAPSRRHVELTIAAADQLIDSLSRNGSAQRLSVRVVLRSGDQREVEAEAHWEAPSTVERRNVTEVA